MWPKRETRPLPGAPQRSVPGADPAAATPADETHRDWRRQRLARIGFEAELASAVAANRAYDLHALIGLVERGCPPRLAVRIVAPLEREGEPC